MKEQQVGRIVFGPYGASTISLPRSFKGKMKRETKEKETNAALAGQLNYFNMILCRINRRLKLIMATQAEHAAALTGFGDRLDKVLAEIQAAVQALKDALATAGATTPEVDAATARLDTGIQKLDDLNEDVPPAPTPAPEPTA